MHADRHHELRAPVSEIDHRLGPADAALTIVEYGGFESPLCKQVAPLLRHVVDRFDGRVRLVYRHFPIEDIHPHALCAAEAAECAASQGRFWEMHDLLFANQERLQPRDLLGYADRLQLDLGRYRAEMSLRSHLGRIRDQARSGRRCRVRSSPAVFVHGKAVDVTFGFKSVVDAVERALDRH